MFHFRESFFLRRSSSPGHASSLPSFFSLSLSLSFSFFLSLSAKHGRGILSSKAVGEPPLLLASTALCAIQAACDAAREGFAARVGSGAGSKPANLNGTIENRSKEGPALSAPRTLLTAPATPAAVKAAIGPVPLAEMVAGGPSGKL